MGVTNCRPSYIHAQGSGHRASDAIHLVQAGIRFGSNDLFRGFAQDPNTGNVSMLNSFLCGLAAGVTESIFVVTPQETIKTKLINMNLPMVSLPP